MGGYMDETPVFHSTEIYLLILCLSPCVIYNTRVRAAGIRM